MMVMWLVAGALLGLCSPASAQTALRIAAVSPSDKASGIESSQTITVTFGEPMVPLGMSSGGGEFMRIDPAVEGSYQWLGTTTLQFTPSEALSPATRFTVTVGEKAVSLNGNRLAAPYSWTFETLRPQLAMSNPVQGERWVQPDRSVFLFFNQPIDAAKAASFIGFAGASLKGMDPAAVKAILEGKQQPAQTRERTFTVVPLPEEVYRDEKNPLHYTFESHRREAGAGSILLLRPDEPLDTGRLYLITLKQGLPARTGNLGLGETSAVVFQTYGAFRYTGPAQVVMYPDDELVLHFSNPVSYAQVMQKTDFQPKVVIPKYYEDREWASHEIYLHLPLAPKRTYTVTVGAGLTDKFGNKLAAPVSIRVVTRSYRPDFRVDTGQNIYEAYLNNPVPMRLVNIDRVHQRITGIELEEIVPFSFRMDEIFTSEGITAMERLIEGRKSGTDRVWKPSVAENVLATQPLNLDGNLKGRYGILLIECEPSATGLKPYRYYNMAQITDLAVTAKFSPENTLVFVSGLKDGKPVAGAGVQIRSGSNAVIWSGKTDANGLFEGPGWSHPGVERPKEQWRTPQLFAIARNGNDLAYVSTSFADITGYASNITYRDSPAATHDYGGSLFTERGLYKAGEEVFIKGIVREKRGGSWTIPALRSADLLVYDSRGQKLAEESVSLNEYGSFSHTLRLPAKCPTGAYRILLNEHVPNVPEEKKKEEWTRKQIYLLDVAGSFQVQAYRPARFETTVTPDRDGYIMGDKLKAKIAGRFLTGGAMNGEKVSYAVMLSTAEFMPEGQRYAGYRFSPGDWEGDKYRFRGTKQIGSGNGLLDKAGEFDVETPVKAADVHTTAKVVVEGTVTGPGRQSISAHGSATVHPAEFYFGVKIDPSLVEAGKVVRISLACVDTQGKSRSGESMTVRILRREWFSVRKEGPGKTFYWVSESKDTLLFTQQVTGTDEPVAVPFTPDGIGYYLVSVSGKDPRGNTVLAGDSFYVYGSGEYGWSLDERSTLDLKADAEKYKPGDEAAIMIPSPYDSATALVTVERELVMERHVLEVKGNAPIIRIPIRDTYLPNVYVNVLLFKGRTGLNTFSAKGEDLGKPSFKVGCINLPVSSTSKKLNVAVSPRGAEFRPRSEVTVDFTVRNNAGTGVESEVTVAVVDLAVLNLIAYNTPDPFDSFYGEQPLGVVTSESRSRLIGQTHYDGAPANKGGGGSGAAFLFRKDFRPTAYFNPSVRTDSQGRASVTFKLPDSLTSFRIMAVAGTKDSRFGSGETRITVNQPLMVTERLPRFSRIGDRFTAGCTVENLTGTDGEAVVTVVAQGGKIVSDTEKKVFLKNGERKDIVFSAETAAEGKAKFVFSARLGRFTDAVEKTIPVLNARTVQTSAAYGSTESTHEEKILIPEKVVPGVGGLQITASSSALAELKGAVSFLTEYPYPCLEQLLSGIAPIVLAGDILIDRGLTSMTESEMRLRVNEVLAKSPTYQDGSGGFSYWPGGEPSPYLSAHALFILSKAAKAGYRVDSAMLDKVAAYLREYLSKDAGSARSPYTPDVSLCVRAYAAYGLALVGKCDRGFVNVLLERLDASPLLGRAWMLKAAVLTGMDDAVVQRVAASLLNPVSVTAGTAQVTEKQAGGFWVIHQTDVVSTAVVLQTLLETHRENPFAEKMVRWLVEQRTNGRWKSTHENMFAFYALNEYFRNNEASRGPFSYTVSLGTRRVLDGTFERPETKSVGLGLDSLEPGRPVPLTFAVQGTGRFYYGMKLSFEPEETLPPAEAGLTVRRRIQTVNGEDMTGKPFRAGEKYVVSIEVATPASRSYVMVEDRLPAGFEVINEEFATTSILDREYLEQKRAGRNVTPWEDFNYVQRYDDRVLLSAEVLSAGVHRFSYLVTAITEGTYHQPPLLAEEMYSPEVFGRGEESEVRVQ